jgi:flagellar hook-length control protein FliK
MDILSVLSKADQPSHKGQPSYTPPEEDFSDYVSRAIDESRDTDTHRDRAEADSARRDDDRRDDIRRNDERRDDVRAAESDRDRDTEKTGDANRTDKPDRDEDRQDVASKPDDEPRDIDDKADKKPEEHADDTSSASTSDTAEPEQAANQGSSAQNAASETTQQGAPQVVVESADAAAAVTSQANGAGASAAQKGVANQPATGAPATGQDGQAIQSGDGTAPNGGKSQQATAPLPKEIAQKILEALNSKTEPGNPGLQAALADVLGKGKGLRVTTNTATGEHRPLINSTMLAATGMDAQTGSGDAASSNAFAAAGQQQNTAASALQKALNGQGTPQHTESGKGAPGASTPTAAGGETITRAAGGGSFADALNSSGGPDTIQLGQTSGTSASSAAPRTNAALAASVNQQVSVQISKAVGAGNDKITIQLDPADLGRVDVKLEISHDGKVMARVTADRAETLDMLQRDQRGLERALQQAGLQTDSNSLNFNLRQGGQSDFGGQFDDGGPSQAEDEQAVPADTLVETTSAIDHTTAADGRLDIQV